MCKEANTGVGIKFSKEFADKVGVLEFSGDVELLDYCCEKAMSLLSTSASIRALYLANAPTTLAPESDNVVVFPTAQEVTE
jgi:succinylarginine dihydrolase